MRNDSDQTIEPGDGDQERTFQGRTPLIGEKATEESPPLSFVVAQEAIEPGGLTSRPGSSYGSTNHGRYAVPIVQRWKPRLVVDFGCGRNDFIEHLRRLGFDGLGIDFAFAEADIARPMHDTGLLDGVADVVTSFDAMEHLLPQDVNPVLDEMRRVAQPRAWFCFSISTRPSRITVGGENLHPTVRPMRWWLDRIARIGIVNNARAEGRYITGRFRP